MAYVRNAFWYWGSDFDLEQAPYHKKGLLEDLGGHESRFVISSSVKDIVHAEVEKRTCLKQLCRTLQPDPNLSSLYGWLSKVWSRFGSLVMYGT